MKNYFFPLLITGSLLFASLGLVIMNHVDGQGHIQCPFETAGVTDCAQVQNPIDFVISHLNAVSRFFSISFNNSFTVFFVLFLALAFTPPSAFKLFTCQSLLARIHLQESFVSPNETLLIRWLALHENSPAFTTGR